MLPTNPTIISSNQAEWPLAGLIKKPSEFNNVKLINVKAPPYNDMNVYDAINSIIENEKSPDQLLVIYFPEGTYYIKKTINLNSSNNQSNIVFRGEGPETVLRFEVGSYKRCFNIHGSYEYGSSEQDVFADIQKHSTIIVTSGYQPNKWFHMYEKNHPDGGPGYSIGQINYFNSTNGRMKYRAAKKYETQKGLKVRTMNPIQNIGFENLKIRRDDMGDSNLGDNFEFKFAG